MSDSSDAINDQLERIVALGYPDVADLTANAFRALARPLLKALEKTELGTDILLVPNRELVSPESLISRTSINRRAGFTTMPARDIVSFLPLNGLEPPEGPFYLVVEPHTGTCYTNREPDAAGFADWVGQLNNGASRESVFQGFAGSAEWADICAQYGILK